jgi:hypothetical protein
MQRSLSLKHFVERTTAGAVPVGGHGTGDPGRKSWKPGPSGADHTRTIFTSFGKNK